MVKISDGIVKSLLQDTQSSFGKRFVAFFFNWNKVDPRYIARLVSRASCVDADGLIEAVRHRSTFVFVYSYPCQEEKGHSLLIALTASAEISMVCTLVTIAPVLLVHAARYIFFQYKMSPDVSGCHVGKTCLSDLARRPAQGPRAAVSCVAATTARSRLLTRVNVLVPSPSVFLDNGKLNGFLFTPVRAVRRADYTE